MSPPLDFLNVVNLVDTIVYSINFSYQIFIATFKNGIDLLLGQLFIIDFCCYIIDDFFSKKFIDQAGGAHSYWAIDPGRLLSFPFGLLSIFPEGASERLLMMVKAVMRWIKY